MTLPGSCDQKVYISTLFGIIQLKYEKILMLDYMDVITLNLFQFWMPGWLS